MLLARPERIQLDAALGESIWIIHGHVATDASLRVLFIKLCVATLKHIDFWVVHVRVHSVVSKTILVAQEAGSVYPCSGSVVVVSFFF